MDKEYFFIIIATFLFSVQFIFTKKYQLSAGTDIEASFFHKAISPIAFGIILFFYNRCRIEFTWFSFLLALLNAVISNIITIFSIRALYRGSVANYSLYLLGGGMVLPIIYGAVFCGDSFGVWKILSIILILSAIAVKFDTKEKADKQAFLCFAGLFLLNGAVGVVSSVHQGGIFQTEKVSSVGFMLLTSLLTVVIGWIAVGACRLKKSKDENLRKSYLRSMPWAMADGICNGVANLLLLIALLRIEPSLQYPMVTGGSIFLSTIFGLIVYKEKPSAKGWLAVLLAVTGTVIIIF